MNKKNRNQISFLFLLIALTGCSSNSYERPEHSNIENLIKQIDIPPNATTEPTKRHTDPLPQTNEVIWIGQSKNIASKTIDNLKQDKEAITKRIIKTALDLISRPYSAFSLDEGSREKLIINLESFDCLLFVEQVLALANAQKTQEFPEIIRKLRYRENQVSYCTRYHYFKYWADAATRNGFISELNSSLPGFQSRKIKLDFMSNHLNSYKPMRLPINKSCILDQEKSSLIEQRYISLSNLPKAIPYLKDGDIFGLVTSAKGLDVTHVGLIERHGSTVDAIHAAPERGVMRSKNLIRYAAGIPDVIGLTFYRPIQ